MATIENRISLLEKQMRELMPPLRPLFVIVKKDSELTPEQLAEIAQAEKEQRKVIEFHVV